jgi:hypothetical protein
VRADGDQRAQLRGSAHDRGVVIDIRFLQSSGVFPVGLNEGDTDFCFPRAGGRRAGVDEQYTLWRFSYLVSEP